MGVVPSIFQRGLPGSTPDLWVSKFVPKFTKKKTYQKGRHFYTLGRFRYSIIDVEFTTQNPREFLCGESVKEFSPRTVVFYMRNPPKMVSIQVGEFLYPN